MEYEKMDELEKQQFNDFKRKMNQQAAEAQIKKLEYNLTDASQDRAFLRRAGPQGFAYSLHILSARRRQRKDKGRGS